MVGAMGTRRPPTNVVPRAKWSLKSLFYPQFESSTIEKKYILRYLKNNLSLKSSFTGHHIN